MMWDVFKIAATFLIGWFLTGAFIRRVARHAARIGYAKGHAHGYAEGTSLLLRAVDHTNNLLSVSRDLGESMTPREYIGLLSDAMITVIQRDREEKGLPNE